MRFRFALLLVPAAVVLSALGACSGQGEGQVCDPRAGNSGNDDCQSGLVCTAKNGVNGARCCPPQGQPATTPECSTTPGTGDASPAPPDGQSQTPNDGASNQDGPRESSLSDAPGEAMAAEGGADGALGDAAPADATGQ